MKIFKENVILKALKESDIDLVGLTLDQYARDICDGHMDVDVCDNDIDMCVAFCYDVDNIDSEYPEMDKFLEKLAKSVKITKEVKGPYGSTLVCDFSSYFKPFNEEWKEFFDMDNSEFSEDEAYYEAVDNLEALISGNAGEKTYKAINDILDGKKEETVNESLKESTNSRLNKEAIAKFIEKAVNDLMTTDYTNSRYILDDDLAIFVGWSDGYDDKEILDYELYKENSPTWRINVGIKVRNDWDWADYDFLDFPWYPDGEVWDTGVTVNKDEDYGKIADWMIESYPNIVAAHEKGEIFYTRDEEEAAGAMNEALASNSGQKSISKNIKVMNYKGTYIVLYHGHNEKEFKDEKSAFDYARKLSKEKKENLEESEKEIINPDDKDYSDGNLYKVLIWSGVGYTLNTFYVYARNEEDALNQVVAYCEKNAPGILIDVSDMEDLVKTDYSSDLEVDNARYGEDWMDVAINDLGYIYVDATREGASKPYFIHGENFNMAKVNEKGELIESSYTNNKLLDAVKDYGIVSANLDEDKCTITFRVPRATDTDDGYVCATVEFIDRVEEALRAMGMDVDVFGEGESASDFGTLTLTYDPKARGLYTEGTKNFTPKQMDDYKKSYESKFGKPVKKAEWLGCIGNDDCGEDYVKINGKNYTFDIATKEIKEEVTFSEPTKATDFNKQSRQVRDFLDYELEDDDTETGGISFNGETVRDFIADTGIKDTDSIDTLNKALTTCGIRPINEGYADDKYRGDDYWKLSDAYVNGDLSDRELAFELINLFSSRSAAIKAFKEITDGKEFPKTEFEPESEIKEISPEEADQFIMNWNNDVTSVDKGRYLTKDGNMYIGIDNRSGDCWVEEFPNKGTAMDWLEDRIEADGSINESATLNPEDLLTKLVEKGLISDFSISADGSGEVDYVIYYEIPGYVGDTTRVLNADSDSVDDLIKAAKLSADTLGEDIYNSLVDENDFFGHESKEELDNRISVEEKILNNITKELENSSKGLNESVDEFGNKETTYLINDGEYAISILEKNPTGGEADLLVKAKDGKGSSAILPGYDQVEGFEFTEEDEPFYSDSAIDSYDIIKLVNKFIPDLKVIKIDRLLDSGNLENVMGGLENE